MQEAPLPPNEEERLAALRQTGILDTEPEACFDRLTDLAAKICGAPIALITLVDVDRQWFKSHVGLEVPETPRDVAFCAHAILQPEIMIVRDALEDARFADNPLVRNDPNIRFYAGSPLVTQDDNAMGTFCVIDTVPRDLDAHQIEALSTLSRHASNLLEFRRIKEQLAENAVEWERASDAADAKASAAALKKLGEDLKRMVQAREASELSIRDLERDLQRIDPGTLLADRRVDELLNEIVEGSERMLSKLGAEDPLRTEVVRIGAAARQARERLAENDPIRPVGRNA